MADPAVKPAVPALDQAGILRGALVADKFVEPGQQGLCLDRGQIKAQKKAQKKQPAAKFWENVRRRMAPISFELPLGTGFSRARSY
jgi:hypothetical protein